MGKVLLGAGAVVLVVYVIKALQGRSEHVPAPEQPPQPEMPITDAGVPGGTP
jgi:hypothetical protein